MKNAICNLVNAINNRFPDCDLLFPRTAASDTELAALSKRVKTSDEHLRFLSLWAESESKLVPPFRILSPDQIIVHLATRIAHWSMVDSMTDFTGWLDDTPENACKRDKSWREDWVPFAFLEDEYRFIDLDPGANGKKGQVVYCSEEGRSLRVEAWTLSDWLETLTKKIPTITHSKYEIHNLPKIA